MILVAITAIEILPSKSGFKQLGVVSDFQIRIFLFSLIISNRNITPVKHRLAGMVLIIWLIW